jgi:Rrf2 family protein
MDLSTTQICAILVIQELDKHELCVGRVVLANQVQMPVEYMASVVRQLIEAGIVESLKGPGGGYALTRPAREITLAEVLEALPSGICPKQPGTMQRVTRIRSTVRQMLLQVLSSKRISDL